MHVVILYSYSHNKVFAELSDRSIPTSAHIYNMLVDVTLRWDALCGQHTWHQTQHDRSRNAAKRTQQPAHRCLLRSSAAATIKQLLQRRLGGRVSLPCRVVLLLLLLLLQIRRAPTDNRAAAVQYRPAAEDDWHGTRQSETAPEDFSPVASVDDRPATTKPQL